MPRSGSCKCLHCHTFFNPEPRAKGRQKYCSDSPCQKQSKRVSQQKWLLKPENQDYFSGPVNVQRVQQWRVENPGYSKKCHVPPDTTVPLQDSLITQAVEKHKETADLKTPEQGPLQDLLTAQPAIFIGFIAHLTGTALQDDILQTGHRLRQLGEDLLHQPRSSQGEQHANPPITQPSATARSSIAVQLD